MGSQTRSSSVWPRQDRRSPVLWSALLRWCPSACNTECHLRCYATTPHTRFEPSGWTGNEEMGYAKSIMDYLFRWMELRFLSGTQLPLFATKEAASGNVGAGPNQASASISHFLHDAYEVGDAPLCTTCGSLMVRNGSCYK